MAKLCCKVVKLFVDVLLKSFHTADMSCPFSPLLAVSSTICMRRRLHNILFSSAMAQLAVREDVGYHEAALHCAQLLHCLDAAVCSAHDETVAWYSRLITSTVGLGLAAAPWWEFGGTTARALAEPGADVRVLHSTLLTTLARCAVLEGAT